MGYQAYLGSRSTSHKDAERKKGLQVFATATSLPHLLEIVLFSEPVISSTAFTEVVRLLNTERHSAKFGAQAQALALFISELKGQFKLRSN